MLKTKEKELGKWLRMNERGNEIGSERTGVKVIS